MGIKVSIGKSMTSPCSLIPPIFFIILRSSMTGLLFHKDLHSVKVIGVAVFLIILVCLSIR